MSVNKPQNRWRKIVIKDLVLKIRRRVVRTIEQRYRIVNTLLHDKRSDYDIRLNSIVLPDKLDISSIDETIVMHITDNYLRHRFDLLGSGWVDVGYNQPCLGVEGYYYNMQKKYSLSKIVPRAYLKKSKSFEHLISEGYDMIDWQKDFKSGFRWNSKEPSFSIKYGQYIGSDIKVPWELARMQHLPRLAIFAIMKEHIRNKVVEEFKNEIIDFYITNPYGLGVNWVCAMDVAIRVSNALLAYDILQNLDSEKLLNIDFQKCLANFVYEHTEFIINNLECNGFVTNNHYLSDLIGIMIATTYMKKTPQISAWLIFSVLEFRKELKKQFYTEGSNIEGSTSYHCLSSELALFAIAMIDYVKNNCLSELENFDRRVLEKLLDNLPTTVQDCFELSEDEVKTISFMPHFILDITKCNNEIVQIGDNDSGCLFRLSPVGQLIPYKQAVAKYKSLCNYKNSIDILFWDENTLNHLPLVSGFSAFFAGYEQIALQYPLEKSLMLCFSDRKTEYQVKINRTIEKVKFEKQEYYKEHTIFLKNKVENLKMHFYKQFGLCIFKSNKFFLSVNIGQEKRHGRGGHIHNDRLSFELYADNRYICIDPGTYIYTGLPKRRDEYRSTVAHNTLTKVGIEQNKMISMFAMDEESKSGIIECDTNLIKLYCTYYGIKQTREIMIEEQSITIKDTCNYPFETKFDMPEQYSNGYGKIVRNRK